MRLKFLAGAGPASYNIEGSMIEGIDTSLFVEGAQFVGNEQTHAAGIFDMFWKGGERHVVLAQPTKTSDMPWAARDAGWINAADYDPQARYVAATNPQALALLESGKAEYWRDSVDGAWTVRAIEMVEQESVA
ncbi:hypothetical protein [Vreelandella nanhaiensis]|uniref:Uncharacterized protein n=1 Tax=Vreelandella nanhaiensis TaxID=1258546 RepID=A0A3S0Z186_9GAMM|nr:hypothetical protein [Halomonas nanhaiensis]RUR34465.1 hypothetical protein ELY38_02425 [Halomonas nanhaiensis]